MTNQPHINIDLASSGAKPSKPPLTPQEVAQRRASKWGVIVGCAIAGAGVALSLVALESNIRLAYNLSAATDSTVRRIVVAIAITLLLALGPTIAAILAHGKPKEEASLMRLWKGALVFSVIGGIYSVMFASAPPLPPEKAEKVAELNRALQYLERPDFLLWEATQGCQAPDERRAAACRTLLDRRERQKAEITAIEGSPMERMFYRLVDLIYALGAILVGSKLCRHGLVTVSESHRMGTGELAIAATPEAPPAPATALPSVGDQAWTEEFTLKQWMKHRLVPKPGGAISSTAAYKDYEQFCIMNFVEPMSDVKFGTKLTAIQKASDGAMGKVTRNGRIFYTGYIMVTELEVIPDMPMVRIAGPS